MKQLEMVCEVLQFIRRGEFMAKQTKPRAFLAPESKHGTDTIRRCEGKWCNRFYSFKKYRTVFGFLIPGDCENRTT